MVANPETRTLTSQDLKRVLQQHFRRFVADVEIVRDGNEPAIRVTFADSPRPAARILSFR